MRILLQLTVAGIPRPAGSKRHVGRGRIVHDCTFTGAWMEKVYWAAKSEFSGPPAAGAVGLRLQFIVPRPKLHYSTAGPIKRRFLTALPTKRGSGGPDGVGGYDLSKMTRAVEDALTGVVWLDDSQVLQIIASKSYVGLPQLDPGVKIMVIDFYQTRGENDVVSKSLAAEGRPEVQGVL